MQLLVPALLLLGLLLLGLDLSLSGYWVAGWRCCKQDRRLCWLPSNDDNIYKNWVRIQMDSHSLNRYL